MAVGSKRSFPPSEMATVVDDKPFPTAMTTYRCTKRLAVLLAYYISIFFGAYYITQAVASPRGWSAISSFLWGVCASVPACVIHNVYNVKDEEFWRRLMEVVPKTEVQKTTEDFRGPEDYRNTIPIALLYSSSIALASCALVMSCADIHFNCCNSA